jgi:hypothetical protein
MKNITWLTIGKNSDNYSLLNIDLKFKKMVEISQHNVKFPIPGAPNPHDNPNMSPDAPIT